MNLTCDTCGRIGNEDDGIEAGGPCQEPCDGIVRHVEPEVEYQITLSNIFDAHDFDDALRQMVEYAHEQAGLAGYRVKNLETGEERFMDAEREGIWD